MVLQLFYSCRTTVEQLFYNCSTVVFLQCIVSQFIADCTSQLTPDRVNIIILSESYDAELCNLKEKWFQIQYRADGIEST